MDGFERGTFGPSHPMDVRRAQATVSADNRFAKLREGMHKQLEDLSRGIEQVPLKAIDAMVDYLFYHHHMLTELLTTAIPPGDAVQQIYMQGRIEQVRILAQELATDAELRRDKARGGHGQGEDGEE